MEKPLAGIFFLTLLVLNVVANPTNFIKLASGRNKRQIIQACPTPCFQCTPGLTCQNNFRYVFINNYYCRFFYHYLTYCFCNCIVKNANLCQLSLKTFFKPEKTQFFLPLISCFFANKSIEIPIFFSGKKCAKIGKIYKASIIPHRI